MENKIKLTLKKDLKLSQIYVTGDNKHFNILAIDEIFKDMSNVKRHQMIYKSLKKYISENIIHAISIRTYTKSEWELNK